MLKSSLLNIKTALFIPIVTLSIYLLYLSYENNQNIILDEAIVINSDDYNYFDPITFRKYYDEIEIENLDTNTIRNEKVTTTGKNELISEIEDDGVFYCIYDYRTMGRMGQKTRYKFKILNYSDSINISDYQIELLEEKMIMIR